MNYRYIILYAGCSGYGSGFGGEFDRKFNYNTWFVSNYLSWHVRKLHLLSDGPYNMFYCNISNGEESVKVTSTASLEVTIHVEKNEIENYLNYSSERERFEYYLSLLERGYQLASAYHDIPILDFLRLHQEFRAGDYKNERLFKKKQLRDYGIVIVLNHVLTSYSYNLIVSVYDLHKNLLGSDSIYETFPDDIFFNKNVRNLIIDKEKIIITDFLDKPQFVCSLNDLSKGIINSVCVDEKTKKYIPNEQNMAEFERLKWQ